MERGIKYSLWNEPKWPVWLFGLGSPTSGTRRRKQFPVQMKKSPDRKAIPQTNFGVCGMNGDTLWNWKSSWNDANERIKNV